MATPSGSKDWRRTNEEKNPCALCYVNPHLHRILRIVIIESPPDIKVMLIELNIKGGSVIFHRNNTINFRQLSDDLSEQFLSVQEDSTGIKLPTKCPTNLGNFDFSGFFTSARKAKTLQEHEQNCKKKNKILEPFIRRFAESLGLNKYNLETTIEYVITSSDKVVLDIDYTYLIKLSGIIKERIELLVHNIFYVSNTTPNEASTSQNLEIKRSTSPDRFEDGEWFEAVDRGRVIPYYSTRYVPVFQKVDKFHEALKKCIHEVEKNMINGFSWYFNEQLNHDLFDPGSPYLSFQQYLEYNKTGKISNPNVLVVKDNPLHLNTNFAYILTQSFYCHHNYVRQYIQENGLLCKCIIKLEKEIPFIIRSLNPLNDTHIFHMIYKSSRYSKPYYEDIFDILIILRNAMHQLSLNEVSMCTIGTSKGFFAYQELDFTEVLKMIKYVFLGTNIQIRIGLNVMKCWDFRSFFQKNRGKPLPELEFSLERTRIEESESSTDDED